MEKRKFHISLSVGAWQDSILTYSTLLGKQPDVEKPERFALWRTETLNFSISKKAGETAGRLRHLGFEVPDGMEYSETTDCNGIMWEHFTEAQQRQEIQEKFGVYDRIDITEV